SPKPQSSIPPSPPKGGSSPTAVDQVVTAFSEMARQSGLSVPRAVTASRRRSLLLRIEEHGLPAVLDAIERIGRSRFCRGENDRGWRADLDFLCQPKSFVSILEGKYDDRPLQQSQSPPRPQSPSMQRHHDIHARLKRELYGEPDEQFAGQTVDLAAGDFRSH
ncbi:DNA replication protein, partial [Sinorhizobium meliloti]